MWHVGRGVKRPHSTYTHYASLSSAENFGHPSSGTTAYVFDDMACLLGQWQHAKLVASSPASAAVDNYWRMLTCLLALDTDLAVNDCQSRQVLLGSSLAT